MIIREITAEDIEYLFDLRSQTRENSMSRAELAAIGITPASITAGLETSLKGWLCVVDDTVAGFTLGDSSTGEMMVIAVHPEYEGRGVGRELMARVQSWLFSCGHTELWLSEFPDPALRAYQFYRRLGWLPTGTIENQHQILKLKKHTLH